MNRSKRLKPIIDIATHDENKAATEMGQAREKLQQQEKLLSELEQYHAEYTRNHLFSSSSGANAVRLQDFRLFLARLEQAIVRQHQLIARSRDELDTSQSHWAEKRSHRKALDNASGRYAVQELRAEDQLEQEQLEEVSALLRLRKLTTA